MTNVIHFDSIDSTNKFFKENYEKFKSFTIAETEFQTLGKGRLDRVWEANKGENLLFSMLIKEKSIIENIGALSMISASIVSKVLMSFGAKNISIKWPNDIYLNNKKVCGILLEGSLPDYVVIGIGINVNQIDFADSLRHPATSLSNEVGHIFDLNEIKQRLYLTLIDTFKNLKDSVQKELNFIRMHNYLFAKKVMLTIDEKEYVGCVLNINDNFELVVKTANDVIKTNTGEINIL